MSIETGLILASGQGKRMGSLANFYPKCLLLIYDRPILYNILTHFENLGVKDTYIVINYQKELIKSYCYDVRADFKQKIKFVEQNDFSGSASAVGLLKEVIDAPFITVLGDDCTFTKSLIGFVHDFYTTNAIVLEAIVKEDNMDVIKSTCCILMDEKNLITKIVEKPANPESNLRGCGVYIFDPKIFPYIESTKIRGVERVITDTISLIVDEKKAYGKILDGINININNCDDLLVANKLYKKYREEL